MHNLRPTATRTRDLLLRRHFRNAPGRCWVWPHVAFRWSDNGWMCPGVALCLWSLAPSLAPRDLISDANVRMLMARGRFPRVSRVGDLIRLSQTRPCVYAPMRRGSATASHAPGCRELRVRLKLSHP